jgi:hypothetical protein
MCRFFLLILLLASTGKLPGQTGCPGCTIELPSNLPADTVFLQDADTGFKNLYYQANVSFRLPKSTTPVSVLDPSVPGGLPIDRISISGLSNLPAGLTWELNETDFTPSDQPDGCVLLCGLPEETGYFLVEVNLTAVVFGIQQTSAFTFPILIYPEPSGDEPVELFGNIGCDSLEITILNNVFSNGSQGFNYHWNFGNGQIDTVENPVPPVYTEPGTYLVDFLATIDTSGYTLSAIKVLEVGCDDFAIPPFVSGNPDLYIIIRDSIGNELVRTDVKEDASVPVTYAVDFELEVQSYQLEVWDEDSGLAGGDDLCGIVSLSRQPADTLVDDNMKVMPTVFHPVLEVRDEDTVWVYESPSIPDISPDLLQLNCKDSLFLTTDLGQTLSWYRDGNFLEESDSAFADIAGKYWALQWDSSGTCFSGSDTARVLDRIYPSTPFFINDNNLLVIADSIAFGNNVQVQWYLNNDAFESGVSFSWCAKESGLYSAVVLDTISGCSDSFAVNIAYNPNFDCLSSIGEENEQRLFLFPNPTDSHLYFSGPFSGKESKIRILNLQGKTVVARTGIKQGAGIDVSKLGPGMYQLLIQSKNDFYRARFIKQ